MSLLTVTVEQIRAETYNDTERHDYGIADAHCYCDLAVCRCEVNDVQTGIVLHVKTFQE